MTQLDRPWLEQYRKIPRESSILYKNVYNPNNAGLSKMNEQTFEEGILKGYPIGEQEAIKKMIADLPPEMRNLSQPEIANLIKRNYEDNQQFGKQFEDTKTYFERKFHLQEQGHNQRMAQLSQGVTPVPVARQQPLNAFRKKPPQPTTVPSTSSATARPSGSSTNPLAERNRQLLLRKQAAFLNSTQSTIPPSTSPIPSASAKRQDLWDYFDWTRKLAQKEIPLPSNVPSSSSLAVGSTANNIAKWISPSLSYSQITQPMLFEAYDRNPELPFGLGPSQNWRKQYGV